MLRCSVRERLWDARHNFPSFSRVDQYTTWPRSVSLLGCLGGRWMGRSATRAATREIDRRTTMGNGWTTTSSRNVSSAVRAASGSAARRLTDGKRRCSGTSGRVPVSAILSRSVPCAASHTTHMPLEEGTSMACSCDGQACQSSAVIRFGAPGERGRNVAIADWRFGRKGRESDATSGELCSASKRRSSCIVVRSSIHAVGSAGGVIPIRDGGGDIP